MSTHRLALLIGVAEYQDSSVKSFGDVIREDHARLREVFRLSGYVVQCNDLDDPMSSTRVQIQDRIECFLKDAPRESTLLLYLSGHGIYHEGVDYLVPSESLISRTQQYEHELVKIDFAGAAEASRARTIVFFLDCCRQGISRSAMAPVNLGWSKGRRARAERKAYVLLYACNSGEFSWYEQQPKEGPAFSYFGRALSDVLHPAHPAERLGEVVQAVREQVQDEVRQARCARQRPVARYESDIKAELAANRVLCLGGIEADTDRLEHGTWWAAVTRFTHWASVHPSRDGRTAVVEAGELFARKCWDEYLQARTRAIADPWRDDGYALRVIARLDDLIDFSGPDLELSLAEALVAVIAPVYREVVLSRALASQPDPCWVDVGPAQNPSNLRGSLERIHQAHPQLTRKARGLERRGEKAEQYGVALWLAHQCIITEPSVWIPEPEGNLSISPRELLPEETHPLLSAILGAANGALLVNLARTMDVGPEHLQSTVGLSSPCIVLVAGDPRSTIRPTVLGHLLALASAMALDPRRTPQVVVEHIGLSDGVQPSDVLDTSMAARWNIVGNRLSVTHRCRHPALDVGLRAYVERAGDLIDHAHLLAAENGGSAALASLPVAVRVDGIGPRTEPDGVPSYSTPHLRFHLAPEELREILMGERLYGDPLIAVRELYQNALDACRYREIRTRYLLKQGRYRGDDPEWHGQISFRVSEEGGRSFIECSDNGIGMGEYELLNAFACAGRRFHDLPDFIEEEREWHKQDDDTLRFYPNSQFGIGVFSYFMLAEELTIDSCRLDTTGRPGELLRVRVPGSGSLFRVQPSGKGKSSGTRIRLFLSEPLEQGTAHQAAERLRQMLWCAEYKTSLQVDGHQTVWPAGALRLPDEHAGLACQSVDPDLWFVEGSSALLADGLIVMDSLEQKDGHLSGTEVYPDALAKVSEQTVANASEDAASEAKSIKQLVVNLRKERRHVLSVDRRRLLSADLSWVDAAVGASSEHLSQWEDLSIAWMASFADRYPKLIDRVVASLASSHLTRQLTFRSRADVKVAIVGCIPGDEELFANILRVQQGRMTPFFAHSDYPRWFLRARLAVIYSQAAPLFGNRSPILNSGVRLYYGYYVGAIRSKLISLGTLVQRWTGVHSRLMSKVLADTRAHGPLRPLDCELLKGHYRRLPKPTGPLIVHFAHSFGENISEVVKRYRRLEAFGGPRVRVGVPLEFKPSDADKEFLSTRLDGETALNSNVISGAHALVRSAQLGMTQQGVDRLMEKYAALGIRRAPGWRRSANVEITPQDLVLLSAADGVTPAGLPLRFLQIVRVAATIGETVGATMDRVESLASFGITLEVSDVGLIAELQPSKSMACLLPHVWSGWYSRPLFWRRKVSSLQLFRAAAEEGWSVGAVVDELAALLEAAGYRLPDLPSACLATTPSKNLVNMLPHTWFVWRPFGMFHLYRYRRYKIGLVVFRAAAKDRCSVGSVVDQLAALVGSARSLHDLGPEHLAIKPSKKDVIAVSLDIDGYGPWLCGSVSASHLARVGKKLGESVQDVRMRMKRAAPFLGLRLPTEYVEHEEPH